VPVTGRRRRRNAAAAGHSSVVTDEPVVRGGAATPSPSPTAVPDTDGQINTTLDRDGLETSVHSEINDYLQGIGEDALT
jgi:hypothetical protein